MSHPSALLLAVMTAAVLAAQDQGKAAGGKTEDKTIVEVIAADRRLTTLSAALKAAGLVEKLSGKGPFTLFAPTNEAFAKASLGDRFRPEDGLLALLEHHLALAQLPSDFVAACKSLPMVQGELEVATVDGLTVGIGKVLQADIVAKNGVLHVIDSVLPGSEPDITDPLIPPLKLEGTKYIQRFHVGRSSDPVNPAVRISIAAGLEWLRMHQDEDGHWSADKFMNHDANGAPCDGHGNPINDVGITGLALLAFLGDGNTLRQGGLRTVVRNGTKWLLAQQRESDGLIGQSSSQEYMYSHAIATLALCEAYGLSNKYRPYKKPVQKALDFICNARNPFGVWRYQPRSGDGDTSITSWMVQALLTARDFDLAVDPQALTSARVWFDSVTDPATGSSGYTKTGEGSSRRVDAVDKFPAARTEALTGAVLLCRYLLREDPKESKTMEPAVQTILRKPPTWNTNDGSIDMYYWYHASHALFQHGGNEWEAWNQRMTDASVKTQRKDGNFRGSWDPIDAWGLDGGRVYSTAMLLLCLESPYRYGRAAAR